MFDRFLFDPKVAKYIATVLISLMCITISLHIIFVVLFPNVPEYVQSEFNVGNEANWPTWLNGTFFLIAGITAFLVGLLNSHEPFFVSRRIVLGWMGIGGIFALLAVDEQLALHDALRPMIGNFFVTNIPGFRPEVGFYMWYIVLGIPGIIIAIPVSIFLYKQLWRFRRPRYLIIFAVILLLANPLSEFLEELPRYIFSESTEDFRLIWDNTFMALQESMEMLSPILFAIAFLNVGYEFINEFEKKKSATTDNAGSVNHGLG